MTYTEFLNELNEHKEQSFSEFQKKLIPTQQTILGVRTPTMRAIAKKYAKDFDDIFSFPNEYFEVTFIKLCLVADLPYEEFLKWVEKCVSWIDNWATCDCFKTNCLKKHKGEFLPILDQLFSNGGEFYQRYVLVTLLYAYIEEEYFSTLLKYIRMADTRLYYVHMAVAWLTAEILIKYYDFGLEILQSEFLDKKTHNKSIQKAIESYRLTNEQKEYLRSLKIK